MQQREDRLWCGVRVDILGNISALIGLQLCIIAWAEGEWTCMVVVDGGSYAL
jgi:hypothetical protein